MVDFVKKEWQFRDIITEGELNRIEEGVEEGITKAEAAQQAADNAQATAEAAQQAADNAQATADEANQKADQNAADLIAHLNKVVTELQGVHGLRIQNGQIEYWDGTQWVTIDTAGAVSSVNGKTGDVVLTASDVGAASLTSFNSHLNDNTRHITQTERNNWNNHLNDSTRHITQSERTNWNNGIITSMSSSSNGSYVRWANGLQICWGMKQGSATPRAGQWNYEYVTLPASFYNSDYTVVVTYYGFPGLPHGYWQKCAAENRLTTRFAIVEAVQQDATQALRYFWIAIGRWK